MRLPGLAMRRLRFRTRHLMIAVAVAALILGCAVLARRRFFPPPPQYPRTPGAWLPGQMSYQPDGEGGFWISQMYHDLDDGMKGIRPPRALLLDCRIRHWGRLTWADEITERIHRPDPPENAAESPGN